MDNWVSSAIMELICMTFAATCYGVCGVIGISLHLNGLICAVLLGLSTVCLWRAIDGGIKLSAHLRADGVDK